MLRKWLKRHNSSVQVARNPPEGRGRFRQSSADAKKGLASNRIFREYQSRQATDIPLCRNNPALWAGFVFLGLCAPRTNGAGLRRMARKPELIWAIREECLMLSPKSCARVAAFPPHVTRPRFNKSMIE
jgi:hypothetical protein